MTGKQQDVIVMNREYFSQWGQDKWVAEGVFGDKRNGYFVDLAAGDGVYLSNTYFLEKNLEWGGICIEAHNKLYEELKKNRSCICEHACVDSIHQKVKYTDDSSINEDSYVKNLFAGIIDEGLDNEASLNTGTYVYKDTVTLKEILDKNNAPKIIDYFSLDVEGAEFRILKDFPFEEYTFLSMSIERPKELLDSILKKHNYVCVQKYEEDSFYVHGSLLHSVSLGRKWKVYYLPVLKTFIPMTILRFQKAIMIVKWRLIGIWFSRILPVVLFPRNYLRNLRCRKK